MKNKFRGTITLVLATVIWGSTFIAQSVGMDYMEPFTFQAVRCGMAVPFLIPFTYLFEPKKSDFRKKWADPSLWKSGIICGSALYVAAGLQQMGIVYTTAGKAGFITAMYIVLVPLLGLFLRRRPSPAAWISVGIAVCGLYLLSCTDISRINRGDILLLGSALAFAVQITLIDRCAGNLDGIRLNCIQCLTCSVLSALTMFLFESPSWENILQCWFPLTYAGVLSMGVAYTLQILGQQDLEPTAASLIMSLESVFALLGGWLILHETMTPTELTGCLLMFSAVMICQIPSKKKA